MTVWFLAFLAIAWIVVYLPSVWRARQKSPFPAVQGFKRRMRLISPRARTAGRWVVVPESRERLLHQAFLRAQDRRRHIFMALVAIALITGVWAVIAGGRLVELHLMVDALAAFYLALMMDARRKLLDREQKVHALHARPTSMSAYETEAYDYVEVGGR